MAKRKRKARRERLHKEPVIREVARLLETGTPTMWRWTSAAHHGLRAAQCLKGTPWHVADKRAEQIVELARHRIGLSTFPSWIEAFGTPHATSAYVYHYCAGCGGYDRDGHDRPWCSPECKGHVTGRRYEAAQRLDDAARCKAVRVIMTGGAEDTRGQRPGRPCRRCGQLFTPARGDQRYCSQVCGVRDRRNIDVRDCLVCASPFRPGRSDNAAYCSRKCKREAHARRLRNKRAATPHTKPCRICGTPFRPSASSKMLCSPACVAIALAANRAKDQARRQAQRAPPHTIECRICGAPFQHHNPRAAYCGPPCVAEMFRRRERAKRRALVCA